MQNPQHYSTFGNFVPLDQEHGVTGTMLLNSWNQMQSGVSGVVTFDTPIVLEKKRILTHLANLTCLEKPTKLRDLLTLMEDAGEAGHP